MGSDGDFVWGGSKPSTANKRNALFVARGLANLGNTCFANSVLQVFAHTERFLRYVSQKQHHKTCQHDKVCMFCIIEDVVVEMRTKGTTPIQPTQLVRHLRLVGKQFHSGQQQDAHEYTCDMCDARGCYLCNRHLRSVILQNFFDVFSTFFRIAVCTIKLYPIPTNLLPSL
eukprot:c5795_g2_i3.p1 GENE.c5795_g2_i3~~c5795_g2_i3.p1  ORF type:complete len:184 (+),score=25.88 c5795_g2_i3:40-552(+)